MENQKAKNNTMQSILKFIFMLSLLYYVFWLIVSIKYSITGISSEYVGIHIESLCNHIHTTYYGFKGFFAGVENCIIYTILKFWFIPLYQVVYIVIKVVDFIKKRKLLNNK